MPSLPIALWEDLAPREKLLLIALSIFLVLTAFYLFFYQPLRAQQMIALERYNKEMSDYQWLRSKTDEIIRLKNQARGIDVMVSGIARVRTEIENSLKQYNLNANVELQDEEEGNQLIVIKFDNQSGAKIMQWLATNTQSGYLLRTLDLSSDTDGTVSATAYFEL